MSKKSNLKNLKNKADDLYKNGFYNEALADYIKISEIDDDYLNMFYIANSYLMLGNYKNAIKYYNIVNKKSDKEMTNKDIILRSVE